MEATSDYDFSIRKINRRIIYSIVLGLVITVGTSFLVVNLAKRELYGYRWDEATATITSIEIKDNGGKDATKKPISSYFITYNYQDRGETITKTQELVPNGEYYLRQLKNEYTVGRKLDLKVNPQDRSEVIIKPEYDGSIFIIISFAIFPIIAFIALCIVVPRLCKRIIKDLNDPLSLKRKFDAHGIRHIDFNSVEKANKDLDWSCLEKSGNSLTSLKVEQYDTRLFVSDSKQTIFIIPIIVFIMFLLTAIVSDSKFFYSVSIIPSIILFFLLRKTIRPNRHFDKSLGYYWEGENFNNNSELLSSDSYNKTPLSRVAALQFLFYKDPKIVYTCEVCKDDSHFELNLLLDNKERVNVYCEAALLPLLKVTDQIADFLNIPIYLDPNITKEKLVCLLKG